MMKDMGAQQKILIAKKMKEDEIRAKRRAQRVEYYKLEFSLIIAFIVFLIVLAIFWTWLYYDTQERWPELKNKTYRERLEKEKRYEAQKILNAMRYLDEQNYEKNKKLITNEE